MIFTTNRSTTRNVYDKSVQKMLPEGYWLELVLGGYVLASTKDGYSVWWQNLDSLTLVSVQTVPKNYIEPCAAGVYEGMINIYGTYFPTRQEYMYRLYTIPEILSLEERPYFE